MNYWKQFVCFSLLILPISLLAQVETSKEAGWLPDWRATVANKLVHPAIRSATVDFPVTAPVKGQIEGRLLSPAGVEIGICTMSAVSPKTLTFILETSKLPPVAAGTKPTKVSDKVMYDNAMSFAAEHIPALDLPDVTMDIDVMDINVNGPASKGDETKDYFMTRRYHGVRIQSLVINVDGEGFIWGCGNSGLRFSAVELGSLIPATPTEKNVRDLMLKELTAQGFANVVLSTPERLLLPDKNGVLHLSWYADATRVEGKETKGTSINYFENEQKCVIYEWKSKTPFRAIQALPPFTSKDEKIVPAVEATPK